MLTHGITPTDAELMLEGEQGTWVSMQLAGPTHGLVDMVMVDITGSASNKEKKYLAGQRHKYSVQLMRLHPPAAASSAAHKAPPALTHAPPSPVAQQTGAKIKIKNIPRY
jgi:hypothetical protein